MSSYVRTENENQHVAAQEAVEKKHRRAFGNVTNIDGCTNRVSRKTAITAANKLTSAQETDENFLAADITMSYNAGNGAERMVSDDRWVLLLQIASQFRQLIGKMREKCLNSMKFVVLQRF